MTMDGRPAPRIVVTLADPTLAADPADRAIAARKNELYVASVARHGATPVPLDQRSGADERRDAFAGMDGLFLTGGADIDPARYGEPVAGSVGIEPERDALEAAAWAAAAERDVPVLGICRGLQAINVFSGGRLLQHVDGHAGPAFGAGPAGTHAVRIVGGSRLARILSPARAVGTLEVNTYHHQGIRAGDLAPGLVPSAWATSPAGDLVEGFESGAGRLILGVQCHPERMESTPAEFERLFAFFVGACRGAPAGSRR